QQRESGKIGKDAVGVGLGGTSLTGKPTLEGNCYASTFTSQENSVP
ncbi:3832_t:CDS:2, partial [Funneliformis geosporum]